MYYLAKYGVQTDIYLPMVKRGVVDLAVTADWTPATGDTKVSKDGGAVANSTNNPAIASGTSWKLTLTATELSAKWITVQIIDSATKAVEDQFINVLTYGNASAFFIAPDYQDAVRFGLTALPNAAAEAAGGLYTRGTGAGQINQPANGLIDGNVERWNGTAVPTEITAGVPLVEWTPSPAELTGTATASAAGTITLAAAASATANFYNGMIILITSGTGKGQARIISGYTTGRVATVTPAWTTTPASTATYILLPVGISDLETLLVSNSATGAALTAAAAGLPDVNAKNHGGTAQTGRDIGASVLLSTGTGTGQLDFTSGVVKANLAQILGTALTETAGQIAGAFKKFFDKATPTGTINSIPDAVAGAAGGLFIAGANAATTANVTGNLTGNVSGSVGSVTGAVGSVTGAVGSVTGAVGSVTGAVGSVTGNVGGNVTGSVGSVAAGGIAAAAFAANAIDSGAIAASGANEIADALLDRAAGVETGYTPRQALRIMLAVLAGKLSGAATTTIAIRDTADTKDRVLATVTADGNRTGVTLDAS